ncbi:MAG: hypothetical protein MRY80_10765 [Oricola sp.]|nr:hypothetical protein [Oricola sp.]
MTIFMRCVSPIHTRVAGKPTILGAARHACRSLSPSPIKRRAKPAATGEYGEKKGKKAPGNGLLRGAGTSHAQKKGIFLKMNNS